jgi:hypothetical protein
MHSSRRDRRLKAAALLLLLLVAFARPAAGAAQEKKAGPRPDFSGVWELDPKQTDSGETRLALVISHSEPEVRIRLRTVEDGVEEITESVYYSDGRGESNPGPTYVEGGTALRRDELKSKTVWKGQALVTRTEVKRVVRGAAAYLIVTDKWTLSEGGRKLTHAQTLWTRNGTYIEAPPKGPAAVTDSGPSEYKTVFRRVPD